MTGEQPLASMGCWHVAPAFCSNPTPCKGPIVIPLSLSRVFSSLILIIHYSVKADGLCGGQSGWQYIYGEHCDQRLQGNDWLSRLRIDGSMVASLLLT